MAHVVVGAAAFIGGFFYTFAFGMVSTTNDKAAGVASAAQAGGAILVQLAWMGLHFVLGERNILWSFAGLCVFGFSSNLAAAYCTWSLGEKYAKTFEGLLKEKEENEQPPKERRDSMASNETVTGKAVGSLASDLGRLCAYKWLDWSTVFILGIFTFALIFPIADIVGRQLAALFRLRGEFVVHSMLAWARAVLAVLSIAAWLAARAVEKARVQLEVSTADGILGPAPDYILQVQPAPPSGGLWTSFPFHFAIMALTGLSFGYVFTCVLDSMPVGIEAKDAAQACSIAIMVLLISINCGSWTALFVAKVVES